MAPCIECGTRKAFFCAECVDDIMIGHGRLPARRAVFQGKQQITHMLDSMQRRAGVTAVIVAARSAGEQYMHMEDKALFDYGVMVGALEFVEKAVTVTEKERLAEVSLRLLAKGPQLFISEHHRCININPVPFQFPRFLCSAELMLADIKLKCFILVFPHSDSLPAQSGKIRAIDIKFAALNSLIGQSF